MTDGVAEISLAALALAFLPAAVVIAVLYRWSTVGRETLYAFGRMLLQLTVIGYVLVYIFDASHPGIVLAVLAFMMLVASWIALRTSNLPRAQLYPRALAAILVGGGSVLLLVTQGVLSLEPAFEPRYVIPLAGMIFASSMNSISLAAERFEAEARRGGDYQAARGTALRASLIPITNSLFAVGLVSLPGMMTGQILSGVSPLVAARYQIMVMCMMFASAGLSASLFLLLMKSRLGLLKPAAEEQRPGDAGPPA
ncbi:ABC transporter permease [Kordiimonas aestuarii]|uniref:ABC transporter permease n=1 Tax=Kordiimonas aestuarii TaxID=1005925 RepID=UPI0021D2C101|nr:ABC transporter permease [Kordiimonas aestuarii]